MRRLLLWAGAASLLVAAVVAAGSALQTPKYEASVQMWVNFQKQGDPRRPIDTRPQDLTQMMAFTIDTRPHAKEAVRHLGLGMSPDELLDNLTVEQIDATNLLRLTYEGTDPEQAARIAGTLAEIASEDTVTVSPRGDDIKLTPVVYKKAPVPDAPASPHPLRNGLIALVVTLALSAALIAWHEYLRR